MIPYSFSTLIQFFHQNVSKKIIIHFPNFSTTLHSFHIFILKRNLDFQGFLQLPVPGSRSSQGLQRPGFIS